MSEHPLKRSLNAFLAIRTLLNQNTREGTEGAKDIAQEMVLLLDDMYVDQWDDDTEDEDANIEHE